MNPQEAAPAGTKPTPTIAQIIRQAIDGLGRGGQADVADALGVRTASVGKWANGHTMPTPRRWPALERALGLESGTLAAAYQEHSPPTQAEQMQLLVDHQRKMVAAIADITARLDRLEALQAVG